MTVHLSLLELASIQMKCEYLSDLSFLDDGQRALLAQKLERLTAEPEDLHDWNDALEYLAQAPPEQTAQAAKGRLIHVLSQPRSAGQINRQNNEEVNTK